MKRTKFLVASLLLMGITFTSCKDEKQTTAEKTVTVHTTYVDSVVAIPEADAKANWAAIDAAYQEHTMNAEASAPSTSDETKAREEIEKSKAKYEELKAKYEAAMAPEPSAAEGRAQQLRDTFFGAGKVGTDMSFAWVNKDNIVSVYETFYNEFNKNEKTYSREDLDEIKAMYEALDARKNTVEKEGLTGKDNLKVAEIKMKFGPKFKWDRVTSKGEENAAAKDAAK